AAGPGCAGIKSPLPDGANIHGPLAPPALAPAPDPDPLPAPPPDDNPPPGSPAPTPPVSGPVELADVLNSVQANFPLLYAVEQERPIAAGQNLSAEGQFDTMLRARGSDQSGTFNNGRLDFSAEQPFADNGIVTFAGWRTGMGNFPIYANDRKTADGGEFRAGISVPVLQNRDIDPRRARLRAAQIAEQIADPVVRRARLDFLRSAAQAYWTWVAAGGQYQVAADLLRLAQERQRFIDRQLREGLITDTVEVLNRRLIASREEALFSAERVVQQAAIRLSLFLRDPVGDPIVPASDRLPPRFQDFVPPKPDPAGLTADVGTAIANRPELARFRLQLERLGVDIKLASNQLMPVVNVFATMSQDVGFSKKTLNGSGPFATDRITPEVGATFELPAQRRDALGRVRTAQAQAAQVLALERYARDDVTAQVQDAVSELSQAFLRIEKAREELKQARRVRDLEAESFRNGRTSLVDLNIQEVAAAEAELKVVTTLAVYFRATAEYLAAIGLDNPAPDTGGAALPRTEPGRRPPEPAREVLPKPRPAGPPAAEKK
ncbi:MAG: TolC family protein, partial [Fimbriiglobus sp.]